MDMPLDAMKEVSQMDDKVAGIISDRMGCRFAWSYSPKNC